MNNPKNQPPPPPAPPAPPASNSSEKRTIVEEGTSMKGAISSSCPVLVQGSVDGEIEGPSVEISATGAVAGKITTTTLSSKGRVAGELDVDVARLSGTVAHKTVVRAAKLEVRLASTTGKLELRFGSGGGGDFS